MPPANAFDSRGLWFPAGPCRARIEPIVARRLPLRAGFQQRDGMENPGPLAARLQPHRELPDAWTRAFDDMVLRLRRSGATDGAPRVGDTLADFALPDAEGRFYSLSEITSSGPCVLSFNRGGWCGFCAEEIGAWAENERALIAAGARMVIITPEIGGQMRRLMQRAGAQSLGLCDVDLGVALRLGLAFPVGPAVLNLYRQEGFDLAYTNGSRNGLLPVPATFLIDRDRVVTFAYVEPDFRVRAEPDVVLSALRDLARV